MRLEEILDGGVLADPERESRLDPELEHGLRLAHDELARQAVLGNAQNHHAAQSIGGFVDGHGVPSQPQVVRRSQTGWSATDYPDGGTGGVRHGTVGRVPVRGGAKALDAIALRHEALECSDRHRRIDGAATARELAGRRAHATTDRGERVRSSRDVICVVIAPFRDGDDISTRVRVHRARSSTRLVVPEPSGIGNTR